MRLRRWAARPLARSLRLVGHAYGSDKVGKHNYAPLYARHLRPRRREPLALLEIGIGGYDDPNAGGQSLRMWRTYLPRAHIVGVDLHPKSIDEPRITFMRGSQADPDFLRKVDHDHGPFDVVIDDGSHVNEHVLLAFDTLFPLLRPGGLYVIEDVETSYDGSAGGGPVGSTHTSVALLKQLVDSLQADFIPDHADQDLPNVGVIAGLHVYRNIAMIDKSNADYGPPDLSPD